MLGKKAATQFFWLVAVIAFFSVALTGDMTIRDFAGGVVAGLMVLLAGYLAPYMFWREKDN